MIGFGYNILDSLIANKLPEEYLDMNYLAAWVAESTLRKVKVRWFEYPWPKDESIEVFLAKQIEAYNQAYFGTSWWSFTGFLKKLFLLLFWAEQKRRCCHLSGLKWAAFVKGHNTTVVDQLIFVRQEDAAEKMEQDKINNYRWKECQEEVAVKIRADAERGRFFSTIDDFGVLLFKDYLISSSQKQAIALCVLEYMAVAGVYQFDLTKKITLEAIGQSLIKLCSLTHIKNRRFYTYVEFAKINMQIFLNALPKDATVKERYLQDFFSRKIIDERAVAQRIAYGRALRERQIPNPNISINSDKIKVSPTIVAVERRRYVGVMERVKMEIEEQDKELAKQNKVLAEQDKKLAEKEQEINLIKEERQALDAEFKRLRVAQAERAREIEPGEFQKEERPTKRQKFFVPAESHPDPDEPQFPPEDDFFLELS